ncbi:MAG: hypothetical protein HKO71_01070, partial [Pseudomonadales bacterium]|nr:hypothetical protein [Pseudomonadales bacterium]
MKKILIPMFGLLVLPLAAPSFAKFYSDSGGEQRDTTKDSRAIFGDFALHANSNYDRDSVPRDQYRLWQRHRFDTRGTSAQGESEAKESREKVAKLRQLSKAERKELRNSAYHKPGSSAGSAGSSK